MSLLLSLYKKNTLEWDDPSVSSIYLLLVEEMEDHYLAYKYVEGVQGLTSILHMERVQVYKPWFTKDYTKLNEQESLVIINSIKKSMRGQIAEANERAITLSSFYSSKLLPILDKIR